MTHISLLRHIPRLSLRIFLLIILCVLIPMYGMFSYLRIRFERNMQDEISGQVIQSIRKSEQEIYQSFKNMAAISSIIISNKSLADAMKNKELSFYQRMVAFDSVLSNISANNLFTTEEVKITFFDLEGRVYSNWSTNYNNYRFLLEQDWVQESVKSGGHITWSMFSPGYIIHTGTGQSPSETYVSMARSMLSEDAANERLGTIIVSIEQRQFGNLLQKYAYNENDRIYVCIDNGEILLRFDNDTHDIQPQIQSAYDRISASSGSMLEMLDGQQYLVSYYTIAHPWTFNGQALHVLHYTSYDSVIRQVDQFSRNMHMSMLVFLLVLIIIAGIISSLIVKPIRILEKQMRNYSIDSRVQGLDIGRRDEIGGLNRTFLVMSDHISELFSRWKREHEVREKYRFDALRAQLNPHFLFNTLGTIRWMAIIRKADNMVRCIDALAGVLKHTMGRGGELSTLEDELQSVRDYIFIQNARYGDRYSLEIDVDLDLQKLYVVRFILQPIVENSIIHGLKHLRRHGLIRIWAEFKDEFLLLYVEDNGKGVSPELLEYLNRYGEESQEKRMTGIGFAHVRERIRIAYGEPCGLAIESRIDDAQGSGYTLVTYTLPVLKNTEQEASDSEQNQPKEDEMT